MPTFHAMEHSHHRNVRVAALKTGQIEFYILAQEIKIEIKTLAEEDRVLKEKTDRITKVKGLGSITAVRYYAKQAASGSLIISGRR
ncbi:hypothetical protein Barb6XT_01880 [Bacteroidales bacterium Barb6XT]|nr:hypothetical protein Barb6XT_01880 [Bacteroidales bacterium Barb6XT]